MKPLRPYLYNAYYQWLIDNDLTPYLLIKTDYPNVDVPPEFIRDNKIILNISPRSIGQYVINDESISFSARFQGMLRNIYIPFGAMEAIYAQETGDGAIFQEEVFYSEENYLIRNEKEVSMKDEKQKNKRKSSHLKLV